MFSIITPTYNRAHTLFRVYDSLISQTDVDFEWIIIDDASTDGTMNLVETWKLQCSKFKISYFKLPINKGKPNAINFGLDYCSRPITIIADSDDSFDKNTISDLKTIWNKVNQTLNSEKIATIWTLVTNENGQLAGEQFPYNFWQVNFKDRVLNRKQMVAGEKWHSWRTEVLKKYKMLHSEHSFVGEGASWNQINKDYDFLCINIIHRTYYKSMDGLIQKEKSRLELEKLKFYYSYYQLYKTSNYDILKYPFYKKYAFEYLKSLFYYKKRDLSLGIVKTLILIFPASLSIPSKIKSYLILKNN
ncbi:hypothetical protein LCGC14_0132100 [marine sediment metagenome]|uniref:Glycosyltransferase 2-like domain-containing protein n=1 Tax=marine sediment metagenome TaxID=412755 RepID=A0A0F9V767_9ZZZZ|nr:glycosyltransferase family 2 protein [Maribacter sp.]HDZ03946.1 glycosyltransferase family 2 protein [Maribacter sp.]HEC39446.1 glycosyltransferase family 2 protein [bacterium]